MQAVLSNMELAAPAAAPLGIAFTRTFRCLGDTRPEFDFVSAGECRRVVVERYVADCFARTYGARITTFMPLLLAMQCGSELNGVAGVRPARSEVLFLERYLDQPIEELLAEKTAQAVSRTKVFELGNLASTRPGTCFMLYIVLANTMYRMGYDYAVFTATRQVARVVDKLNFCTFALGHADPARLGNAAADWGSYYRSSPQVMAVDLRSSIQIFAGMPLQAITTRLFAADINALGDIAAATGRL